MTQIQVKEQLVVRKNMDVNEHERLSNITLKHKLKEQILLLLFYLSVKAWFSTM